MATVRFHPEAREELEQAFEWYMERSRSAAESFLAEFDRGLAVLAASPSVWPEFESGSRRYILRRYPFSIVYRLADDLIEVIAVAISVGSRTTGGTDERHDHSFQLPSTRASFSATSRLPSGIFSLFSSVGGCSQLNSSSVRPQRSSLEG